MTSFSRVADSVLDATLIGYTRIGYALRPRAPLPRMDGKVVLVTGASSGLGRAAAEGFERLGASVLDVVRDPARARPGADVRVCDVSSLAGIRRFAATLGHVDVLVNNAAVRLSSRLLDTTPAEMDHIFGVNVRGPFLMWRHFVPAMVARGRGNVVNVCSTNAPTQPFVGMAPYRMTKVALTYLSADLASEVRDDGVAVNAFDPGAVVSEGTAAIRREREERYGISVPYHPQDDAAVLDEPIRWLAAQTVDTFTGRFVRRVDFGRTWGPTDQA
jgi:NAD(P)-dependent dehydrogenase (short-subunit alcohol dehydrogenase family)